MGGGTPWITWLFFAAALLLIVTGLVVAAFSLFRDRSRGRRRCPRCWYSMDGLGLTCPECGHAAKHEPGLHRTRRRWKRAALGALLIIAGIGAGLTPTLRSRGFSPLVPTTAMILGMDRFNPAFLEKHLPRRIDSGLWKWQERMLVRRALATLGSPDAARRRYAIRVMYDLAPRLQPDPTPFAALLTDSDSQVRDFANGILRFVVKPGEHADLIPKVHAAMLVESQYWTGLRFGSTLGHFGEPALPALKEAATHTDPKIRERAMWGLGHLAATSAAAADMLTASMADPDPAVRYRAVHAVGQEIAPEARARMIDALHRMSGDSNAEAAQVAAMRLKLLTETTDTGSAP